MASSSFNHESDTGWNNLTATTGIQVGDQGFAYRKVGRMVTVVFDLKVITMPSSSTWATLPNAITPSKNATIALAPYYAGGHRAAVFICQNNGTFVCYGPENDQRYIGTLTYPV